MNEVIPEVWQERIARLRLGVEPVDALGRRGPLAGIGLHLEDVQRPAPLPPAPRAAEPFGEVTSAVGLPAVHRNPSGRFAIAFGTKALDDRARLRVRIVDPQRRYVPRRLSIPVPALADVLAADAAHELDPTQPLTLRACRPALFPGANYGAPAGATLLRGRVSWAAGGPPAQWVRVVAFASQAPQPRQPIGRAQGDDRGEFLLILGTLTRELALGASQTIDVEVRGTARSVPDPDDPNNPVDSPTGSRDDPLWHLPVEPVGSLAPDDPVAAGTVDPAGFTDSFTAVVTCRRGSSTTASFVLT
jgi:hypothetical protein